MKIATWNVNSIRACEGRLAAWLTKHQPDVLCLRELKVRDDQLPQPSDHAPVVVELDA